MTKSQTYFARTSSEALTEISKSGLPKPNKVAIFDGNGGDLKEKMNKKDKKSQIKKRIFGIFGAKKDIKNSKEDHS
jgi:hypothetical protein